MSSKMENETEILTTAEFFEKLQQDKLSTPLPFGILGMVKKTEGKERTIAFAPGVHCSNWVTIPLEFIETVEMIRTIPCKDHSHPLVKLNMKTPKTPEGKMFFAMLEGMTPAYEAMQRGIEANTNELQVSSNSSVKQRFSSGFWGCTDTYCGCDNPLDCFLMGASGKCRGRKVICGRNGCVCIPPAL
jgi:hypothetical protein